MHYRPGDTFSYEFVVTDATGALVTPSAGPTPTVTVNGTTDDWGTWTVTAVATGHYRISATIPSDLTDPSRVAVMISATVDGLATARIVNFTIDRAEVDMWLVEGAEPLGADPTVPTAAENAAACEALIVPQVNPAAVHAYKIGGIEAGRLAYWGALSTLANGVIPADQATDGNYRLVMGSTARIKAVLPGDGTRAITVLAQPAIGS